MKDGSTMMKGVMVKTGIMAEGPAGDIVITVMKMSVQTMSGVVVEGITEVTARIFINNQYLAKQASIFRL